MTRRGVRTALFLTLVMLISTVALPVAAENFSSSLETTDRKVKEVSGATTAQQSPTSSTPAESPPYFDMTGGTVAPGENITIWVSFYNDGSLTDKMDVQLSFAEPIDFDGWDIVSFGAPGKGSWFEGERYFSADSVSADSVVEANFTVQVPANATAGTYTIETSFTSYTKDGSRTESTPNATIEVTGSDNQAPTANFTYSPSNPSAGTSISFDGSDSTDSDGSISSYEWDFDNDGTADTTGVTATHSFQSSGDQTVSLTITDDAGATDVISKTISVEENATTQPSGVSAEFSPTTVSANPGGSTTVDVMGTNIDNGVKSYSYTATISNTSVATITNVELIGASQGGLGVNVTITADGSKAIVSVAQGDDNNGVFSTLTLSTQNAGTTTLQMSEITLGDDDFSSYNITSTTNATIEVSEASAPPAVVGNNKPTDPDGDGKFDDITGDGTTNILDVGALLQNRNSATIQNNPDKFDFTGDGRVNILDVGKLLQQVL